MGWAEIVESLHPGIPIGGRYCGWYPMSRYVDFTATPTADGFRDGGPHRAAHAPVYRAYVATDRDPFHEPGSESEDRHALLRGLYITGWLAEDWFADHEWFGARRVLVPSASSKTAIGFARCADSREGIEVIGVTSHRSHAFTHSLGCYDEVLAYDDLQSIPSSSPPGTGALPGPKPAFFLAPTQVKKRVQDWGARGYEERLASAAQEFVGWNRGWLRVQHSRGATAAGATWREVHAGRVPPDVGHVVSLWD